MKPWQRAFHNAIAPHLTTDGLTALAEALRTDDPTLIQGETVEPWTDSFRATAACAIGYCAWKSGAQMVREVNAEFRRIVQCSKLSDPHEHFIRWFDAVSRERMLTELLPEVKRVLRERNTQEALPSARE